MDKVLEKSIRLSYIVWYIEITSLLVSHLGVGECIVSKLESLVDKIR